MDEEMITEDELDADDTEQEDEPGGESVSSFVELKSFKAIDGETGAGGFEGYGAVYNNVDLGGDVMRPNSVKNVDALLREGFIGLNHGWDDLPIGWLTDVRQDSHGLWIQTAYHSHEKAQTARRVALERLEAGKIVGLSIGYSVHPNGMRSLADGTRELVAVDVHEVSQVNAAMNPSAMIDAAKRLARESHWSKESAARLAAVVTLSKQSEIAAESLADIGAFVTRAKLLADLRAKEGRVLSSANRTRLSTLSDALKAVLADIEKLLADTEPDKSLDLDRLYADFARLSAQANGVQIP